MSVEAVAERIKRFPRAERDRVAAEIDALIASIEGPVPFPAYLEAAMKARGMEPWPYQPILAEMLGKHRDIVIGKARQIGVTELLCDYARYMVQSGKRVLVISKGQPESEDFLSRAEITALPGATIDKENTRQVRLGNGGIIRALPATRHAGRSFTADLVIVDEAAFHPWAATNFKAYRPTMADVGQLVIVSTGNGQSGFFHDYYQDAKAGTNGFTSRFFGYYERPDRDEEKWNAEAAAYQGVPGGHTAENPRTEAEMFISHSGLVYGTDQDDGALIFDPARNLTAPPFTWAGAELRVIGIDPGGRDPTALVAIGLDGRDRAHVFAAKRWRGPQSVDALADYISAIEDSGEVHGIVVDGSGGGTMVAETLYAMGWNAFVASKDKGNRISTMKSWLKAGRLTLAAGHTDLIEEFHSYFWKDRQDNVSGGNAWETMTVGQHHADLLDCLGYAVQSAQLVSFRGADAERPVPIGMSDRYRDSGRAATLREHLERKRVRA